MELIIEKSSIALLPKYMELYKACFNGVGHLQLPYLQWLYGMNPLGEAIGADALFGDDVVGQVLAVPGEFELRGKVVKGLVAMNVAVHPSFQGRRLFAKLGLRMCEYGADHGYDFVSGVANQAATPGWIRQMGFQLVGPLEARIGFGGLGVKNYDEIIKKSEFRHYWRNETLQWRANNPENRVCLTSTGDSRVMKAFASAGKKGISAFAEMPCTYDVPLSETLTSHTLLPRVFLGLIPGHQFPPNFFSIPKKLRPSPLNLIYKNLNDGKDRIDPLTCFINFLDFDAF